LQRLDGQQAADAIDVPGLRSVMAINAVSAMQYMLTFDALNNHRWWSLQDVQWWVLMFAEG
jgi:hypothetical protein